MLCCDVNDSGPVLRVIHTSDKTVLSLGSVSCPETRGTNLDRFCSTVCATTRIHVFISTGSGTGRAQSVWTGLLRPLLAHFGLEELRHYRVHFTTSETSVAEWTTKWILPLAQSIRSPLVILLSGDGGVVDMINALTSPPTPFTPPEIALVPVGTGNALATSTGIEKLGSSLRTLLYGTPRPLPIFRTTFSPNARLLSDHGRTHTPFPTTPPTLHGAVVFSWALHAAIVADSDTPVLRAHGPARFQHAAQQALLPTPHPYRGTVSFRPPDTTHWHVIPRDAHGYILAALVRALEPGFTINPAASRAGMPPQPPLRLVHFGPLDAGATAELLRLAYAEGAHVRDERVGYEDVGAVRVVMTAGEEERWRRVCVDGRIVVLEEGGWVEVEMMAEKEWVVKILVEP